jgi:WD40 repeat protein
MTLTYSQIVAQHQALQKEETAEASPERTERVKAFIAEMVAAGANIADPRQREQLRNFLRYWSAYVYDHTQEYPPSQLVPFAGTGSGRAWFDLRNFMPGLLWTIVGVVLTLVVVLAPKVFTGSTFGPTQTSVAAQTQTMESVGLATQSALITRTTAAVATGTPAALPTDMPTPEPTATPLPTPTDVPGALFSLQGVGTIGAVAFSPDGKFLASSDGEGKANAIIVLWNIEDQTRVWKSLPLENNYIFSLAFSPSNGGTLAFGAQDGQLGLLNTRDGSLLISRQAHSDSVTSVAFSPDGARLATGSLGGISGCKAATVAFWDPDTLASLQQVEQGKPVDCLSDNPQLSIAFSPDGNLLAVGGSDRKVKLWDLNTRRLLTLGEHTDIVWSVAFSPDGKELASASQEGSIKLWDVEKRTLITTLNGQATSLFAMAFSPDPNRLRLASAGSAADGGGLIELWNIDVALQGEIQTPTSLTGHTAVVRSLAFSPDGKLLASGSRDRTVIVWKVP